MKRKTKPNQPKAKKNDIVLHNGEKWTVLEREFDPVRSQSFYLLRTGKGRNRTVKWARSDTFAVK